MKENIILNRYVEQSSFIFDLQTENLRLNQEGDVINVYSADGNKILYSLAPPYMLDADGNSYDQVKYTLTQNGTSYKLEVVPDQGWLAAPDRVYPVRIDPTTKIFQGGFDSYAEERYPTTHTWPQNHLYIGYDDGVKSRNNEFYKKESITYLQFDLSELDNSDQISKAELQLYKITRWSSERDRPANLYRITENKAINDITWSERPQLSGVIATALVKNGAGIHKWDITQTVQEWVGGQQPNNGLALMFQNNRTQAEVFASMDAGNLYPVPFIAVDYEQGGNPPTTEDPYTSISLEKESNEDHTVTVKGSAGNAETLEYFLYRAGEEIESGDISAIPEWQLEFEGLDQNTLYRVEVEPVRIDLIPQTNPNGTVTMIEKEVRGERVVSQDFILTEVQDKYSIFDLVYHFYNPSSDSAYSPWIAKIRELNPSIGLDADGVPIFAAKMKVLFPEPLRTDPPCKPKPGTVDNIVKIWRMTFGQAKNMRQGGDPVNPHTGNFFDIEDDLTLEGPGIPLVLQRTYNTMMDQDYVGIFGRKWDFSYDRRLSFFPDGTVGMPLGNGSTTYFELKANGYKNFSGFFGTFTKTAEGYSYTDKYGINYRFNEVGLLLSINDRNDNYISFAHNQAGLITSLIDTAGREFVFLYNNDRLVTDILVPGEKILHYEYDANKNLRSFSDLEGNTKEYTYDSLDRMKSIIDPEGNKRLTNYYDSEDRVARQENAEGSIFTFQYFANYTVETDNEGNAKYHYYDERNRLVRTVYPEGEVETYTYDSEDNRDTYKAPKGQSYDYDYDPLGNRTYILDPLGNQINYTYDEFSNIKTIRDSKGGITKFTYDNKGNLKNATDPEGRITSYTYNSRGQVETVADALGNKTQYFYDDNGYLRKIIDPAGNKTTYYPDALGRVVGIEDPKGNYTRIVQDKMGRPLHVQMPENTEMHYTYYDHGKVESFTDPKGNMTYYTYDDMQRLKSVLDPEGGVTQYDYDRNGNKKKVVDPEGGVNTFWYDDNDRLEYSIGPEGERTEYTYDDNGNVETVKDPEGNVTSYHYDDLNRLQEVIDPLSNKTSYKYDHLGNIEEQLLPDGNKISYEYNKVSQPTKIINQELGETLMTYYPNGQLKTQTNAEGYTYEYTYTLLGKVWTIKDPLGNITEYNYDANNNLQEVTNALGHQTKYEYDKLNRLRKVSDPLGNTAEIIPDPNGNIATQIDAEGNVTNFEYNGTNSLTKVINAKGHETEYDYYLTGLLKWTKDPKGNATSYEYDQSGRVTKVTDPAGHVVSFGYDKNGNVQARTKPDGSTMEYIYDPLNRLEQVTYPDDTKVTYTYDVMGNRQSMDDKLGQTAYEYDEMNRLTKVTNPQGESVDYDYDILGRLTWVSYPDGKEVDYLYDELNRLKEVKDWSNRVTKYSYDAIGRRLGTDLPGGLQVNYSYDEANRLTDLRNLGPSGQILTAFKYEYDKNGNRVSEYKNYRNEEQSTTTYFYDSLNQLGKVLNSYGEDYTYQYDSAGNKISMEKTEGDEVEVTNYEYNSLNQLMALTKENDDYKVEYQYDINGNRTKVTEPGHRFTDYAYDYENRLTYMYQYRAKVEDPEATGAIQATELEVGEKTTLTAPSSKSQGKGNGNSSGNNGKNKSKEGIPTTTPGLPGLPQQGNEFIEQTYGYDGDGNRIFSTVRLTTFSSPFEEEAVSLDQAEGSISGKDNKGQPQLDKPKKKELFAPKDSGGNNNGNGGNSGGGNNGGGNSGNSGNGGNNGQKNDTKEDKDNKGTTKDNEKDKGKGQDKQNEKVAKRDKINEEKVKKAKKEKSNNGKHLGWYKRVDHPKYPGQGEEVEEVFHAINYVNDINRPFTEVLMVSNEEGEYTGAYLYGTERIMAETVPIEVELEEEAGTVGEPAEKQQGKAKGKQKKVQQEEQNEVQNQIQNQEPANIQPERFDPLFYLNDGLGSAAQLVNEQGEVWNKFMFDPYGEPHAAGKLLLNRNKEELLYTPYGFTGEAHDLYNGLIYLRARYYDPTVGSFISQDSYMGELNNPISQNRYTYAQNNPVNMIDPSGHIPLPGTHSAYADGPLGLASGVIDDGTEEPKISGNSGGNDKDNYPTGGDSKTGEMKASDKLVNFLSDYERFMAKPYYATQEEKRKGIRTIGFGHVIRPGENFDNGITFEQAKELLEKDLKSREETVRRLTKGTTLNQQQFDALVDFQFNTGNLKSSTLLKDVLSGNASDEQLLKDFLSWTRQGDNRLKNLYQRRYDEWEIFTEGEYERNERKAPAGYI